MILVQTDEQLVRHFELILRNERSSIASARTQKDQAVAKSRAQLAAEALHIVQAHAQQAADLAREAAGRA